MAEKQESQEGAVRPLSLLAKEVFGANFHGEVPEAATEEATEEATEVEEQEVTEEAVEATDEEADTEEATEAATEGAEDEPSEEGEPISSLPELIEHYELDADWAKTLKIPVKVDHETVEPSLDELIDGYRTNRAADKRLEEAKAEKERAQRETAQKIEEIEAAFGQAGKLVEHAEAMLQKDIEKVDWNRLREDDPAEYSAKKTEIAERRQEIEKLKQTGQEAVSAYRQQTQQMSQEQRAELLQNEQAALLERLPEWQDAEKAKAEQAEIANDLISRGFDRDDVLQASDHRLVLLARDAWLYRQMKEKTNVASKKVAKVPKAMKPGAPKPQEQQSKEQADKLRQKLRKTGSLDDATALRLLRAKGQ